MTTATETICEILSTIGLTVTLVRDPSGERGWVTEEHMSASEGRRAVAAMRAAGYEASDAGDGEDSSLAWLYVRTAEVRS